MKQKLLKTIVLALAVLGGANATWADNNTSYTICVEGIETDYTDLATAIGAVTDNTLTTIYINADITVTSGISFTSSANANKQVNIVAGVDNVTIKSGQTERLFTVNSGSASLRLGGGSYRLVIDGDNKSYGSGFISVEADKGKSSNTDYSYFLDNVTIKNVKATANDGNGYVYQRKNSGHDQQVFRNVTFENCQVTGTGSVGIVRYLRQSTLYLEGIINFTSCTGTTFYMENTKSILRNKSSNLGDLTISNPITLNLANAGTSYLLNQNILVLFSHTNAANVSLVNSDYGLYDTGNGTNNGDVKLRQAYTLTVSDALAATLVLPFATASLPTNASAYDLTYTSGNDITASLVSAITADAPVLITTTEAGNYKFVSNATTAASTPSGQTSANGVLIGNYDADYVVPADNYILTNHSGNVGFRKANGTTNKVQAYRAYMSAAYTTGAREFLGIDFGDGNVTAIEAVEKKALAEDSEVYNLQGVRMTGGNLSKGIYVKNSKKFIVK